jgi:hypothetical protein
VLDAEPDRQLLTAHNPDIPRAIDRPEFRGVLNEVDVDAAQRPSRPQDGYPVEQVPIDVAAPGQPSHGVELVGCIDGNPAGYWRACCGEHRHWRSRQACATGVELTDLDGEFRERPGIERAGRRGGLADRRRQPEEVRVRSSACRASDAGDAHAEEDNRGDSTWAQHQAGDHRLSTKRPGNGEVNSVTPHSLRDDHADVMECWVEAGTVETYHRSWP